MNHHSSRQQSMNAQRKNHNIQESAIANDHEFDELVNFRLDDIWIRAVGTLNYPIPQEFRGHPLVKAWKNAKVYLYNDSDVRWVSIDGEILFYLTNEQFREKVVQRILSQSQWRVDAIHISSLEAFCFPSEVNEALQRKKYIAQGVYLEWPINQEVLMLVRDIVSKRIWHSFWWNFVIPWNSHEVQLLQFIVGKWCCFEELSGLELREAWFRDAIVFKINPTGIFNKLLSQYNIHH